MGKTQEIILIIAIIVLILAILLAAFRYRYFYKHEHFECPKCGYSWKPSILKMIFSENAVDGKVIKCPKCGDREYIEPAKDK